MAAAMAEAFPLLVAAGVLLLGVAGAEPPDVGLDVVGTGTGAAAGFGLLHAAASRTVPMTRVKTRRGVGMARSEGDGGTRYVRPNGKTARGHP